MKPTIMLIIATMIAMGAMAQKNSGKSEDLKPQVLPTDSVIMKEGSVLYSKSGERTVIITEIIIGGTKVQADGAVIFKDGSTDVLKEGDMILADGKLVRATIKVERDLPEEKRQ